MGIDTGSIFVGRSTELEELRRGLGDTLAGRGRLFMLVGDAGIGKTRLADEIAAAAVDQGARVLWGRCWESGGAPAFWPWVQALRAYVADTDTPTLAAQLGHGAADLAQILPEVRARLGVTVAPASDEPEQARFQLFDSTTNFLRNAAQQHKLVLILEDLARHFERALETDTRMRARPAVARTQFEYARLLLQRDEPARARAFLEAARATAREIGMVGLDQRIDALVAADARLAQLGASAAAREAAPGVTAGRFTLKGEFWNVGFGGTNFQLKAILGLTYIAHLLRHPRREFHVTDLIDLIEGRPVDAAKGAAREASARSLGDAGEVLDAQAKAEYRRRLAELREELEEAEELNDLGRVDRARDEIEAVSDQLAEGIGLGGRQRRVASHVERARVSVTKRIAIAIKKVNEHDPALAAYLRARIKTGTLCGYEPDPGRPVVWEL